MNEIKTESLFQFYLNAKQQVIDAGYAEEIDWEADMQFERVDEHFFLMQVAWVILCSGFRAETVKARWQQISEAFLGFYVALDIVECSRWCFEEAIKVFGHRDKINAIIEVAEHVNEVGIDSIKANILENGPTWLTRYRFIGKITCYHLARNLGLDCVKPDRHLVRITEAWGYDEPLTMCKAIAAVTGDRLGVVDLVLWRWAESYPRRKHGSLQEAMEGAMTCQNGK